MLQRYEKVIQVYERTLIYAKKNFSMVVGDNNKVDYRPKHDESSIMLWGWRPVSKSYFQLEELEVDLDFLEEHKLLRSPKAKYGRHEEVVKHYSNVVSVIFKSRPLIATRLGNYVLTC